MTIKEALDKVENYNELAEVLRNYQICLEVTYDKHFCERFYNYRQFRTWVRREILDEIAKQILAYKDWDFGKEANFRTGNNWFEADCTMEINIYETNLRVWEHQ